jgi:type II secretory pathway pseudopilin PulG
MKNALLILCAVALPGAVMADAAARVEEVRTQLETRLTALQTHLKTLTDCQSSGRVFNGTSCQEPDVNYTVLLENITVLPTIEVEADVVTVNTVTTKKVDGWNNGKLGSFNTYTYTCSWGQTRLVSHADAEQIITQPYMCKSRTTTQWDG